MIITTLGRIYTHKNQFKEASKAFYEAKKIYENFSKQDTAEYGTLLANMGEYSLMICDYKEAESNFERALLLRQKNNGPGSYEVAITHNNLATLYRILEQLDKAYFHIGEAMRIALSKFPDGHAEFREILNKNMMTIFKIRKTKG